MQMETQLQRIHRQRTKTPPMLQNMRNTIHRLQHGLRPMPQKVPSQTHKRSRRRTRTQNMRRMRRQNQPIHPRMQNMHETPMEPSKKSKHTNTTANMQQMRIRHDLPQPQMQNLQIPRRIKQKTRQTPTHTTNHPRTRTKTQNKGNPRPTHHRNATRTSRIHPRSPGKAQEKTSH